MTEMVHPPVVKSLQKLLVPLETLVETYRIEQNSSLEAQPCNAVEGTSKKSIPYCHWTDRHLLSYQLLHFLSTRTRCQLWS